MSCDTFHTFFLSRPNLENWVTLTIAISDPTTIELLQYRRYVEQVDDLQASEEQLATGLVVGLLDAHHRFRDWRKELLSESRAA